MIFLSIANLYILFRVFSLFTFNVITDKIGNKSAHKFTFIIIALYIKVCNYFLNQIGEKIIINKK
jgi:hypothetical protein